MRRLLIRPGAIGDFITSLPALEHLRAAYTEVWCAGAVTPLVRFADRVCSIASSGLDGLEIASVDSRQVRARLTGFDEIVSWYGSARDEFRHAVRELPFRFHAALPAAEHAVDFYARQVGALLGQRPRLPVRRWNGGFVAIHPTSGSARKNWPRENFEAVAAALQAEWCHERFDDLWQLAAWLAGARLYIGNDSGITHLAAACGIPVIAIFQDSDPLVWAPRGARVLWRPHVDEVLAEADALQD